MSENTSDEGKHLLAVYGTLKENFPNYFYYLNPLVPIFRGMVQIPYEMYSNGGFPLLFSSDKQNKIYVEIFEVTDRIIKKIDRLEGVPHLYSRATIWIDEISVNAFLYVIENREPTGELIEDGIFKRKDDDQFI